MRGLEHGDGLETEEAADAVVGVHDEIADRQARRLGEHVDGTALLAARAHQAIAEDVLLADDGDLRRLETLLEAQHADGGRVAGQRQRLGVGFHALHVLEAVVAEQRRQPLARAGRPRGDDDAARLALQAADVPDDGVEYVDVALLALGGEGAAAAAAPGAHVGSLAFLERRQLERRPVGLRRGERFGVEEQALGRHRLIGRPAELVLLQRFVARVVVLGDLLEAALGRFIAAMVEADRHTRQIVEQRLEMIVEQRQPMLLARIAVAAADRLIQRIIAGVAAEQLDIARAEQLLGFLAERDFAHRHQRQLLHRLGRALRRDVEGLDRLQRVAEEVETHGGRPPGRIEIEDTAAHGVLALLHDRAAARIAHQR